MKLINLTKRICWGGGDYAGRVHYDGIMEFEPLTGQWKYVDRMINGRFEHSMAVINFEPELCV